MAMYKMIYPETRMVQGSWLLMKAEDAFVNREIERRPEGVDDAIYLLSDAGFITVEGI